MKKILSAFILSLFLIQNVYSAVPNTFVDGTVASAGDVNSNFDYFENKFSTTAGHDHDNTDSKLLTTLGTITSGKWQGTILDMPYGGTNLSSYATGDLIAATSDTVLTRIATADVGNVLLSDGNRIPRWGKVTLGSHISGDLPIANLNSGTNATSSTFWRGDGAWSNIVTVAQGEVLYGSAANTISALAVGTANQALITNGAAANPSWADTGSAVSFLVNNSAEQTNIALNSDVTVVFDTEIFDTGDDFASNTFTAPVTGKYQFSYSLFVLSIDSAATVYTIKIVTSNRTYSHRFTALQEVTADTDITLNFSILADMDVNDTAYVVINQTGGTQQTDLDAADCWFSGFLVF